MIAIALNGPGGAGKTTLAKQLSVTHGVHHHSFDEWFSDVARSKVKDVWDSRVELFFAELRRLLESGMHVAVDAPFQFKSWPSMLRAASDGHGLLVVELHCDFDTLVARVEKREGSCDDHCRKHIQYMRDRIYGLLPGQLSFDTTNGVEDAAQGISEHLAAQQGNSGGRLRRR